MGHRRNSFPSLAGSSNGHRLRPGPGGPPRHTVNQIQRARIAAAALDASAEVGYARLSVAILISRAGVSRRTFYELFADREDCLSYVHASIEAEMLGRLDAALASRPAAEHLTIVVQEVLRYAECEPVRARFLMNEMMRGSVVALSQRDHTLEMIEHLLLRSYRRLGEQDIAPDVCLRALLGALFRLVGACVAERLARPSDLADELIDWISSYNRPASEHRWLVLQTDNPAHLELEASAPRSMSPQGSTRQRLVRAGGEIAMQKGVSQSTIAEIADRAGLDRRSFGAVFSDKQELFLAIQRNGYQANLVQVADAYFSARHWPDRVWEGLRALNEYLARHPVYARISFVECGAIGVAATQRAQDACTGFLVFLREGYRHARRRPPGEVGLAAIAATIFELVYRQAMNGNRTSVVDQTGYLGHLCLAPFIGVSAASHFIEQRLREQSAG